MASVRRVQFVGSSHDGSPPTAGARGVALINEGVQGSVRRVQYEGSSHDGPPQEREELPAEGPAPIRTTAEQKCGVVPRRARN